MSGFSGDRGSEFVPSDHLELEGEIVRDVEQGVSHEWRERWGVADLQCMGKGEGETLTHDRDLVE